jgi:uncharacterized membrane protein YciS (DUF1049 family)
MEVDGFLKTKVSVNYFELAKKYAVRSSDRFDAKSRLYSGVVHGHHVHPRSLGGSDVESNIVYITAQEHYELHRLLAGMFAIGASARNKMTYAFHMMSEAGDLDANRYAMKVEPPRKTQQQKKQDHNTAVLRFLAKNTPKKSYA